MNPNETHPSQLSQEAKDALMRSDPTAFDMDDDGTDDGAGAAAGAAEGGAGGEGDAGAAAGAAGAEGAAAGEGAGAAADGADAGAAAGAEGGAAAAAGAAAMIPKARFDEVLGKAKDLERRVEEMEQRNKAMAAPASDRDFAKESEALKEKLDTGTEVLLKKYEDADIELPELQRELNKLQAEYQNGMREIGVAEARYGALSAVHEQSQKAAIDQATQSWESTLTAWKTSNADFLSNPIRQQAVASLIESLGADANLSDEDLLKKVEEAAFEAFNWSKQAAPAPANPHAARNAADAAAAARASAAPASAAEVGVGSRGGPSQSVDLENLKPGEFSKLPKAEQERLLGEGAL